MTEQEIFNEVWAAMEKQGRPSVSNGDCMYRGPGGLKCAVGWLLTDEEYSGRMEGNLVGDIKLPERLYPFVELLCALQCAHDSARSGFDTTWLGDFKRRAVKVADEYGLTVPGESQ